ncbi:MAG TPA: hypothetical protein PKA64_01485 [Myxococcota bacterium]|nr:hypothetical protein [Myxococcota bacterium]
MLAAMHGEGDASARGEQARSLLRVARIRQHQPDACRRLLGLREDVTRRQPKPSPRPWGLSRSVGGPAIG